MKKIIVLFLSLILLVSLVACNSSSDDNKDTEPSVEDTGIIADTTPDETKPADTEADDTTEKVEIPAFDYMENDLASYIKIGDYTTISVEMNAETLTDEEYNDKVAELLSAYEYTPFITEDRAAQEGDTLSVSFAGYINGELVDNTSVSQTDLTITENSGYIPGFVEGYIGHKKGESFDFDVTFPENYHNADLAGVTVTFRGSIHGIYDGTEAIPLPIEEFVKNYTEFESVDEFNTYFRGMLNQELYYEALSGAYDTIWNEVLEISEVLAYPGQEVERVYAMYKENYEMYAQSYGVDYETFLKDYMNSSVEALRENCELYVKEDLVLYQLIKDFNIEVTEEEFEFGCEVYAENFGITIDQLLQYYDRETIELSILYEEVLTVLSEKVEIIGK